MNPSNSQILKTFLNQFNEFLEDILRIFPNDEDLITAKVYFDGVRKINPRIIICYWKFLIAHKYNDEVENENIDTEEIAIIDWDQNEKIKKEFESIGFFVGEHPLKSNLGILKQYKVLSYLDFKNNKSKDAMVAGTLISIQEKKTAKGNPYAIIKFVDLNSMFELFIFSERLIENRNNLLVGNSFLIKVKKEKNKDGIVRINLDNIFLIDDLKNKNIEKVTFKIKNINSLSLIKERLNQKGSSKVVIIFEDKSSGIYSFALNSRLKIKQKDIEFLENNHVKSYF